MKIQKFRLYDGTFVYRCKNCLETFQTLKQFDKHLQQDLNGNSDCRYTIQKRLESI